MSVAFEHGYASAARLPRTAEADHLVRADVGVCCGVVSSGLWPSGTAAGIVIIAGILLAGPLVCATSQAVNDWYDRHVDAINEPHRPIPSGRMPGRWGLYIAIVWTALSLAVAATAGPVGLRRRGRRAGRWPGPTARRRCG